jgi:hypothetical protein
VTAIKAANQPIDADMINMLKKVSATLKCNEKSD